MIGETEFVFGRLVTYKDLRLLVGQYQSALRAAGVQEGDRVAALVPNCIESVIFMLATASLGAIWSAASTDFGVVGVLDRFKQIEPKVLVSVDSVIYNGKNHNNMEKLKAVSQGLPSLAKVVVFPHVGIPENIASVKNAVLLSDFLTGHYLQEPVFAQVTFDHPLVILFSSGTTGNTHLTIIYDIRCAKMYMSFRWWHTNPASQGAHYSWKH